MKKDLRFALMFDEFTKKPFIMVDADIITEGIGRFKGKWQGFYVMPNNPRFILLAYFKEWKEFDRPMELLNKDNGYREIFKKSEWDKMRKAVKDRCLQPSH